MLGAPGLGRRLEEAIICKPKYINKQEPYTFIDRVHVLVHFSMSLLICLFVCLLEVYFGCLILQLATSAVWDHIMLPIIERPLQ